MYIELSSFYLLVLYLIVNLVVRVPLRRRKISCPAGSVSIDAFLILASSKTRLRADQVFLTGLHGGAALNSLQRGTVRLGDALGGFDRGSETATDDQLSTIGFQTRRKMTRTVLQHED